MTVCEYKTRVFTGREEMPLGASNVQKLWRFAAERGTARPSSVADGSTLDAFPACFFLY